MGTNVLQVCDDEPGRDGSGRRTSRLTVRGESATPNFSSSSATIRSSPQVRFARAMQGAQMESGSCGEQVLVVLSWQDTSGGWPLMVTINEPWTGDESAVGRLCVGRQLGHCSPDRVCEVERSK
jgi:hypothetical protein